MISFLTDSKVISFPRKLQNIFEQQTIAHLWVTKLLISVRRRSIVTAECYEQKGFRIGLPDFRFLTCITP